MHTRTASSSIHPHLCRAVFLAWALAAGALRAQPTLTTPATSNLGAGQVTLTFKASAAGTGYFTLLEGATPVPGNGTQTKAGRDGTGAAAARFGSLKLAANAAATYTVRELKACTPYTVCFTADDGATVQGTSTTKTFTTAPMPDLSGRGWASYGPRGVNDSNTIYNCLALAPDGTPYVAYQDCDYSGRLTVRRLSGGSWVNVGSRGFSAGRVGQLSFVISPDGAPWVAYSDDNDSGRLVVRRFNGSSWVQIGAAGLSESYAYSPTLAFAPDGAAHVVFSDPLQESDGWKAKVRRFDGSAWTPVGPAEGISSTGALYTTLAFAADGSLYVAFKELATTEPSALDGRATVMKYDGANWTAVGPMGFTAGEIEDLRLAVGPEGEPYVAFRDYAHGYRGSVMRFRSGTWSYVGAPGFTRGMAFDMALVFAPDGVPWVALYESDKTTDAFVYRLAGDTWSRVGEEGCALDGSGCYLSLAFAPDGGPRVQLHDMDNEGRAAVVHLVPPGPTTYAAWVAANFSAADQARPEISGAEADPDGAGVTNLQRFAHNLAARGPVAAPATAAICERMIDYDFHYYHSLWFTRRSCAPGLSYRLEASSDLVSWSTISAWKADASLQVQALDEVEFASVPRRFLRLRTTLEPAAMKVLVPAYFYPVGGAADNWSKLSAVAAKHPAGTIYAIANVANGPDSGQDGDRVAYQRAIAAFRAAGGRVLGYVFTSYGARAQKTVMDDIDLWYARFPVDGIFLDEQANTAGALGYYRALRDHIKGKGGEALVAANPGTATIEGYMSMNDVTCVFETAGPSSFPTWTPAPWTASYPAAKFSVLPYGCSAANMTSFLARAAANNVGWIYVTDDTPDNPWDTLPSYFEALVAGAAGVR
ncbi:MAG TPA: spherulation-specific family 4 protein [Opitutaceae bacterium]|nr:spherulation-specific family 4 protein [Opitutaceae bacterium]